MKIIKQVLLYLTLCLNILLVFLSAVSAKLVLPDWLSFSGRLHPLLLHFPLAILLLSASLYLIRRLIGLEQERTFSILLFISSFSAVLSALSGLFLSMDGGYDEQTLQQHQWSGVTIAVLAYILFLAHRSNWPVFWIRNIAALSIGVIVWGSHLGGVLTHGEDFLAFAPAEKEMQAPVVTETSVVFTSLVEPVLKAKCYSCHNDQKSKGELVMTSLNKLLKGGKTGPLWVAGDPLNSHIVERMDLPEDDKKHMPPKGKAQVTSRERALIEAWIQHGADMKKRVMDYPAADSFRTFLASYLQATDVQKSWGFQAASSSDIEAAQSPYCYVSPVAAGSPALQVRFLIRSGFKSEMLKNLERIAQQVVQINLSNMPVKDEDLRIMKTFQNLEILNLNGSDVTGLGLQYLSENKALHSLALSNTKADVAAFEKLPKTIPSLKQLYCWNTVVTNVLVKKWQAFNPQVLWYIGFIPDQTEILQLTSAQLADNDKFILGPGDSIRFKHPMPGAIIRYTLDGSAPDSLKSPAYQTPLHFSKATQVRTITVRSGWLTSDTTDHTFFVRSAQNPAFKRFLQPPDKSYAAQFEATLFDNKKGEPGNFREGFVGMKENHFDLLCGFAEPTFIQEILVSTVKNTASYIMPPEKVELWAGDDTLRMKKINQVLPIQPGRNERSKIELHRLSVNGRYRFFRLKLFNVQKLPVWHEGKGQKGWVFIDEIFFN